MTNFVDNSKCIGLLGIKLVIQQVQNIWHYGVKMSLITVQKFNDLTKSIPQGRLQMICIFYSEK